jgi:Zinc knuckle/SWIM zinc finger
MSTAFPKSLNNWMRDIRDVSQLGLHVGMVRKSTTLMYERWNLYNNVGTPFPRSTLAELENTRRIGRTLPVIRSTDTLVTVNDYSVDLSGPTASCQCGSYDQTGLPCIHMAAIDDNVMGMVHPSYLTTTLRQVYAGVVAPITVHDLVPDGETQPQAQRRQAGRPKILRIRHRSEYRPEDSPYVCKRCGVPGHNRRTCERRQFAVERDRAAELRRERTERQRQREEEELLHAEGQPIPSPRRARGRPRRNRPT